MQKLIVILILAVSPCISFARQHPCTDAEAMQADTETDTIHSWDSLHSSYKRYRQCDDGGVAEGYSEDVIRILADHWSTLSRLATLAKRDAGFRRFVLSHVDATVSEDDLEKVKTYANTKCPPNLGSLCADLAKAADDALKEAFENGLRSGGIGYRLVPVQLSWPEELQAGDLLMLHSTWVNRNAGRLYVRYPLRIYLTDANGDTGRP